MMLPFYDRWMKRFPTLELLAKAKESDVVKMWEGLGYYSRARNILKTAQIIQSQKKGFPKKIEELLLLPGVGAYTASAIASIAHDVATLPVDGNVIRVLSRINLISDALNSADDKKRVHLLANQIATLVPSGQRGNMSQALMELGAMICRPAQLAQCDACPVKKHCEAFKHSKVAAIPQTKKRPAMKELSRILLVYRNAEGDPLLRKRPDKAVLGGQWEIPYIDLETSKEWLRENLLPHFELHYAFRHTIMNTTYQLWWLEGGRLQRALPGHVFGVDAVQGDPLASITRKALHFAQTF